MSVQLRPYQISAVEEIRESLRRGFRKILVVAPTGSGKTIVASHIMRSSVLRQKPSLFLAHRKELIDQAYAKLLEFDIAEREVGVIRANEKKHRRPDALVQVASVQTLSHRPPPSASLVFVDEAHRVMAASYRKVVDQYQGSVHIGLTATPWRLDCKSLGDIYETVVFVAQPMELIEQGYLVLPKIYSHPRSPDVSKVKVRGGDFVEDELDHVVNQPKYIGNIVEHWIQMANGLPTVAFAASISHSKNIRDAFLAAGISAEHIDGETPMAQREEILGSKEILGRFRSGTTKVVCNVNVLTEGWDCPEAKCAILARPTLSKTLYIQCAGRVLRPHGGQRAIILDHAGCARCHGRPEEDREVSLDEDIRPPRGSGRSMVKTCPECFGVSHLSAKVCQECGYAFTSTAEEDPVKATGQLVEFDLPPQNELKKELERLAGIAKEKNYKPGWVAYQFKKKFGFWPSRRLMPKTEVTEEGMRAMFLKLKKEMEEKGHKISWVSVKFDKIFGRFPPYAWTMELQPKTEEWAL